MDSFNINFINIITKISSCIISWVNGVEEGIARGEHVLPLMIGKAHSRVDYIFNWDVQNPLTGYSGKLRCVGSSIQVKTFYSFF